MKHLIKTKKELMDKLKQLYIGGEIEYQMYDYPSEPIKSIKDNKDSSTAFIISVDWNIGRLQCMTRSNKYYDFGDRIEEWDENDDVFKIYRPDLNILRKSKLDEIKAGDMYFVNPWTLKTMEYPEMTFKANKQLMRMDKLNEI